MIVDRLAAMDGWIASLIKDAFIIRVPFPIYRSAMPGNPLSLAARSIPPYRSINDVTFVDWREMRLPYRNMVIASIYDEWGALMVRSTPRDDGKTREMIDIVGVTMAPEANCVETMAQRTYISMDGIGRSLKAKNSSDQGSEQDIAIQQAVMYSLGCPSDILARMRRRNPSFDHILRANEILTMEMFAGATAALLTCKNVRHEVIEPDAALQRRRQERGKLPLYRYHVLKVKPMGAAHGSHGHGENGDTAIHWVRGHFKRYTEDKKLFGKHTGLYWWQPHLAGSALRFVEKDYEVQAV